MNLLARRRMHLAAAAALAALVLAGVALPGPSRAAGLSFGFGIGPGMYYRDDEGEDYGGACLTDHLLRKFLAEDGYARIRLGIGNSDHHMVAHGDRDGSEYRLLVNWCSGKVLERTRIGPARS